jgi:calmodulin
MADTDEMLRSIHEKLEKKKMRPSDLFKSIDATADAGTVTVDELRAGLVKIGYRLSDADFTTLMSRLDKKGTGNVSLKEFEKAMQVAEKPPPKKKDGDAPKKKQGLTTEDKEEFRQIFCLFKQLSQDRLRNDEGQVDLVDMDDTGTISVDELEQLLETVGLRLQASELDAMVREIDLDGNGEIDFEEFCQTMQRKIQVEYPPEEIAKSFKAFSYNAPEGLIRVSDLSNALKTYMHKELVENEVDELIRHYKDCFVKIPGSDQEYFNYQDYIDLMSPMTDNHAAGE